MDVPDLKDHACLHIPWTNLKKLNLNQLTNSVQVTPLEVRDEKGTLLRHTEITSKQLFVFYYFYETHRLNNNVTKKVLQHCVLTNLLPSRSMLHQNYLQVMLIWILKIKQIMLQSCFEVSKQLKKCALIEDSPNPIFFSNLVYYQFIA